MSAGGAARGSIDEMPWRVIDPRGPGARAYLGELWRHREILGFLVWRDVKVRYKQTVLGVAWAVLQPLAGTVVFALFFLRTRRILPLVLAHTLLDVVSFVGYALLHNHLGFLR